MTTTAQKRQGFDTKVHHRDPRTKAVNRVNPYRLYCIQGKKYFERPVGSGNLWFEGGEPAGRMEKDEKTGEKKILKDAPHIEWEAPKTDDQKLKEFVVSTAQENESLKKELEALKAERAQELQALEQSEEKKDAKRRTRTTNPE